MVLPDKTSFNEIAWNGIRFVAPIVWTPAQIGTRYLMLEQHSAPILEIKWEPVKGSFSHDRQLRQLSARHNKHLRKTVRLCTLPADWQQALGAFYVGGFQWQGPQLSGMGATLYCPVCQTATLIQFYRGNPADDDAANLKLLASFQDHPRDDHILWSVFDIRARVPAFLNLQRHHFAAGYFELKFSSNIHTVVLNRWGPASILLAGKDLAGFARSAAPFPASPPPVFIENQDGFQWTLPPAAGRWAQLSRRMCLQPRLQQLSMWHLSEKNRILAVRVNGRRPLPQSVFNEICKGFECV